MYLRDNGLEKGDVVLVMVPRLIEAYVTYIGALKAGLVVIPSSEMLRPTDIDYRLKHSGAKAIVAYEAYSDQFEEVKNMENIQLFIVGDAKEGQLSLTELMESESTEFSASETKSSDMAFLSYTSGTTGSTKRSRPYTCLGICTFTNNWCKLAWNRRRRCCLGNSGTGMAKMDMDTISFRT